MGELNGFLTHLYTEDLVGSLVAVLAGKHLIASKCQAVVVTHAHGDSVHLLGGDIHAEDGLHTLERADEIDGLLVGRPSDSVNAVVPILGEVLLVACGIHEEDAVLVGLIAVMLHREPSHLALAVDDGISVITHHALRQVLGLASFEVILVQVAVGRESIILTRLLAAYIHQALAVGGPSQRLDATPGLHRRLVGLTLEHVLDVASLAAVIVGHKGVRNRGHPLVPVLVHHVVIDLARGVLQIGIDVLSRLTILDLGDHHHALLVGREDEALDAVLDVAHAVAATTISIHRPQLRCLVLALFPVDEGNLLAAVNPHIVALAVGRVGDLLAVLAVNIHHPEVTVTLVGLDVVIGHTIQDLFAIKRHLGSAHASQLIEEFGRKLFLLHRCRGFLGGRSLARRSLLLRAGRGAQQSQSSH